MVSSFLIWSHESIEGSAVSVSQLVLSELKKNLTIFASFAKIRTHARGAASDENRDDDSVLGVKLN